MTERNITFVTESISWIWLAEWIACKPIFVQSWEPCRHLKAIAEKALRPYENRYKQLETEWKRKLEPVCGKFCSTNWERFRPLRQSREEDWSDWLAWILETSTTGVLAEGLFGSLMGCDRDSFRSPTKKVEREFPTENRERRADLLAEWDNGSITHVEVKLWDQNFEKIFETSKLLRSRRPRGIRWTDIILIPESSRSAWSALAEKNYSHSINEISWNDVVQSIRKSLWQASEPIFWQAWAWAFCSAIESRILGLYCLDQFAHINQLAMAANWVRILEMDSKKSEQYMKPEMEKFLKNGVRLYTEAQDTLSMFEAEMQKLLKAAVDAGTNCLPFKNPRVIEKKWGRDVNQYWVYTTIQGDLPKETNGAWIECGLWWNAPGTTEPIVYAGLWNNKEELVKFNWKNGTNGIRSLELRSGYIYMPIPESLEIQEPISRLLKTLSKELGKMIELES